MRSIGGSLVFVAIMLLVDFYVFMAVKSVSQLAGQRTRFLIYGAYWLVAIFSLAFLQPFLIFNPIAGLNLFALIYFATLVAVFWPKLLPCPFFWLMTCVGQVSGFSICL